MVSAVRYMLTVLIIGFVFSIAHAMDAETLRKETGWPNGLVVVFGKPELALDLGKDGRQLVLWLHSDAEVVYDMRERILKAGLQGLVTADLVPPGTIPLRGEMANVVAVDTSLAGVQAPTTEEIDRVLIPGGSHYSKVKDSWVDRTKAWPEGYGSWTEREHGPHGNPVADDQVAMRMRGVQWMGAYGQLNGDLDPLIKGDTVVLSYTMPRKMPRYGSHHMWKPLKDPNYVSKLKPEIRARLEAPHHKRSKDTEGHWRAGRDAFNGLSLWALRFHQSAAHEMVLAGNVALFPWMEKPYWGTVWPKEDLRYPIRAVDLRTGELLHTFDKAPHLTYPVLDKRTPQGKWHDEKAIPAMMTAWEDRVYIAGLGGVVACRVADGDPIWSMKSQARLVSLPTLSPDGKLLYGFESDVSPKRVRYFGQNKIKNLVCIETERGAVIWRRPLDVDHASDLIAVEQGVVVGRMSMHGWNIPKALNKPEEAGIELIDTKGKQVWLVQSVKPAFRGNEVIGQGAQNMLVKDGYVYAAEHYRFIRIQLATGEVDAFAHSNVGCQRMFATKDQIGLANTVFINWQGTEELSWTYQGVIHPDCGVGLTIGNGRFYARSPKMCDCNFHLRTVVSFHSEMPVAAVTDDQRLVPPHSFPKATTTAASPRPESLGQSLIMDEWTIGGWYEGSGQYGPVFVRNDDTVYGWQAENDGTTFLPRVHAGRLEALQGEKLLWAQQLGGRPAGAPALAGGLVIQACRDGYVYAFHPKTGTLRWRFLAARADQRLVNSGQLESVWPCVGAVLHEGSIVVAAGISPELDGGGLVWGLDPESGAIRWKVPLVTDPVSGSGMDGRKRVSFHGHHTNGQGFVIQGIRVVEGMVAVGYRRTSNFGSHGSNFWAWVGIDPKKNEPLDPVERLLKGIQCWRENDLGVLTPQKAAGPNYRSNK